MQIPLQKMSQVLVCLSLLLNGCCISWFMLRRRQSSLGTTRSGHPLDFYYHKNFRRYPYATEQILSLSSPQSVSSSITHHAVCTSACTLIYTISYLHISPLFLSPSLLGTPLTKKLSQNLKVTSEQISWTG